MKVRCVNSKDCEHRLTFGKIYEVICDTGIFYKIKDDIAEEGFYLISSFEKVDEMKEINGEESKQFNKQQYFEVAKAAMQGLLSNSEAFQHYINPIEKAFEYTDGFMVELEKRLKDK